MGKRKYGNIIFQFTNNWKHKDFALGFNFASQRNDYYDKSSDREYYGSFHLGFWQLFIGIKI